MRLSRLLAGTTIIVVWAVDNIAALIDPSRAPIATVANAPLLIVAGYLFGRELLRKHNDDEK